MNPAHVHLLLNHVPILGAAFALPLLVWAIVRRSDEVARLALVALVAVAALTIPVFRSGEPAEDEVENLPGVSEHWIEQHEDIAKLALGASLLMGVVALGGLLAFRSKPVPIGFTTLALLLTLGTAALMTTTGWHGGHIRHTEIRPVGAPGAAGSDSAAAAGARQEHDEGEADDDAKNEGAGR